VRSWAEELEAVGDVLGDRIKRSLDAPTGSSFGVRAKLSLEATQAAQRGQGQAAVALLRQLGGFEALWQHGVIVRLRPRLYAEEVAPEPRTVERLYELLNEPIARFLQELALPGGWIVQASGSARSLVAVLERAGIRLRVLRLGEASELRAFREDQRRDAAGIEALSGVEALARLLNASGGEGGSAGVLDPSSREMLHPSRGLLMFCWHGISMPLWCVGAADNPTRAARVQAWLDRPEPTAMALTLVARGLWDRSSRVRERALGGLDRLGLVAAALVPELLRVRREASAWSRALYDSIDGLTQDPACVDAFVPRLRVDEPAHLRWLRGTSSVGAKWALPDLKRALAIVPVPLAFGTVPPAWRRREWHDLVAHLRSR